ncbi:MAG: SDR family NAD(P)-dependent oxidoreductase, partial [Bacteroidales bacterium]|nr:SDR family NAD(P)-dependent oxidoreductase [Bacteroidales bacterium]
LLITGAANGLGKATAVEFAQHGWNVIATDVDSAITDLAGIDGIIPKEMDVTSAESVKRVFEEVRQEYGLLDLIINNAGVDRYFPLSEAPLESFREIFEINLFGAYRVNQVFLPLVKSPGGRMIVIGSESYHLTLPFMPYPLTKRAVESYARALRTELKFRGIDVVVVRPGPILTNFIKNLSGIRYYCHCDTPEASGGEATVSDPGLSEAFKKFVASVPGEVGRVVSPEKVASFIYRVSHIAHPRSVYRINNSFQLRLASILPFRIFEKMIYRRLT